MRLIAVLFLLTSCSLIPNATIRWHGPEQVEFDGWPPGPMELVGANAVPPPDLIWFDDSVDPENALGLNATQEALARQAGLAPGWFDLEGPRVLPLAWNPWSWWRFEGAEPPMKPSEADRRALALYQGYTEGPTLSGSSTPLPSGIRGQEVWLSWADVQASPDRVKLQQVESEVVIARVRGFWWNARGWNRERTGEWLVDLWTSERLDRLAQPGWLPVHKGPRALKILVVPNSD